LGVPSSSSDAAAAASDAVRLFADRAAMARAGFSVSAANLEPVAEICRRLDGIPLAIELAAARVTAMSPAEIGQRLDERFRLLTGARRDRVERHQTLRSTVEWSYSLLDDRERAVFDRVGVFVGGFTAAAAEAVVADDDIEAWDVVEGLTSLVEKSMVLAEEEAADGTTRYRLLETMRAFAREKLDANDQTDHWRRRHAAYYATFAEEAGRALSGPDELPWVRRLEADFDNIRAALRWGADAPEQADADLALRIIIGLAQFGPRVSWGMGGWAEMLAPRARASTLDDRTLVLTHAGSWHVLRDELEQAQELAREALGVVDDPSPRAVSWSYFVLASATYRQGDTSGGLELIAEAHGALDAQHAEPRYHADLHGLASLLLLSVGDLEGAGREADAMLEIARLRHNPTTMAGALGYVGRARFTEDPGGALAALEESIALTRAGAADGFYTIVLAGASQLRARAGDRQGALEDLRAAIAFDHDMGQRSGVGLTIERAVAILSSSRDDELAAMCFGIVQSGAVTRFRSLPQVDRTAARLGERMGTDAYEAAVARGAALGAEEVVPALLAELDRLLAAASSA
ncbi:MAG TPA: hypothetical protein VEP49_10600, partial [Acidimicrobiia bacterium]|nr:hypothetical protein [Acidimicrobiia bacterium]